MDILIESTKNFEQDLHGLREIEKAAVISKINDCASHFSAQEAENCPDLHRPSRLLNLNGYESSLYILRVSQTLRVILAIDEDPIFGQNIFTLFRVVNLRELDQSYEAIAESLYQELPHFERKATQIY
ncbi:MAG: hypothetical protein HC879_18980 [Leptolyngbyaceae cyanobacterium SL_5_9]|nr:hypothetical protein [Leptolyngbyaceae cyanobacterium SM1_4_3]NJN59424.1 hypothetical protein [Leptolyngbyaceae cyanobacterium SL_5_9]NJO81157.1 hypothetical protein [Cyanobacteria bacterium RM1_2_2]